MHKKIMEISILIISFAKSGHKCKSRFLKYCSVIRTNATDCRTCKTKTLLEHIFKKDRTYNKKELQFPELFFSNIGTSNDLSSREATLRVLSALEVFTTVFGMGTGGVLSLCHQKIFFRSSIKKIFRALKVAQ